MDNDKKKIEVEVKKGMIDYPFNGRDIFCFLVLALIDYIWATVDSGFLLAMAAVGIISNLIWGVYKMSKKAKTIKNE
jgi:hypothetical protein